MELEVFAGQEKSELSMIEVARAILELRGRDHEMHFSDLVNEIQNYLGTSNSDIREALPLFYTELNFDGSFMMKIQMMRKMKWKLTMQKSTKSLLMTWVKTWILTKKTTSFLTMMLKRVKKSKRLRRGDRKISFFIP